MPLPLPAEHTAEPKATAAGADVDDLEAAQCRTRAAAAEAVQEPADPLSYTAARKVVDKQGAWAASYSSDHGSLRLSVQFMDRAAAELPAGLAQQLAGCLQATAVLQSEASLHADTCLLTVQLLLAQQDALAAAEGGLSVVLQLATAPGAHRLWRDGTVLLQVRGLAGLVVGKRRQCHDRASEAVTTLGCDLPCCLCRLPPSLCIFGATCGH